MITISQQQTITLGKKIAASFKGGDVVLLEGELGAGKTTLMKGIAKFFGVKKNITSPTFTLMNIYGIRNTKNTKLRNLIHIDTYRLKDEEDLLEIGAEDYLGAADAVCVIEWPEKISTLLKNKKTISITIEHKSKNKRMIEIRDRR